MTRTRSVSEGERPTKPPISSLVKRSPSLTLRVSGAILFVALIGSPTTAFAQRRVNFPPAEAPPPPPVKAPQKMEASGEDTGVIPDPGPGQRKTQTRTPPPPTNLTVMHKIEYGETLEYVHTDGTVQKFE